MKKFVLMFAALLSFTGIAKAETLTETFDDVTVTSRYLLSNGWVMVHNNGNYQGFGGSYDYQIKSGNYDGETGNSLYCDYSDNNEYVVIPTKLTGTFTYYVKRSSSSNGTVTFFEATKNGDDFTVTSTQLATISTSSSWSQKSFNLGDEGKYVAIRLLKSRIDQISATVYEQTTGPALAVYDGSTKLASGDNYDFGIAKAGTEKTFTLSNPGTTDLEVSLSEIGHFNATLSATTIAAGGEVTLTTTMPGDDELLGYGTGSEITITPADGSGIAPFIVNVTGVVRDMNKVYESGFTTLPEDWTTTGSWYYSADNGAYTTVWYLTSNARLITPQLTISEGEIFYVEAKGYSTSNTDYQHLQMQYSADGTTWTNFDSEPELKSSKWNMFAFAGVPAGKYYIAINASQADVRVFYGGELPKEPKMVVTQPASLDFGVIESSTTKTFTIANTGRATLEGISVTSSNSSIFSVSNAPTSLAAGESAEVTITMAATTTGVLSSDIKVSATGMDNVEFTITGIVLPDGLMVVDFNDNALPTGWGNNASNKWSFSDGKAYCTSASELVTPKLSVADGDMLVIKATSYDDYDNNYLEIYGSADGSTWDSTPIKKFISRSQIPYDSYTTLVITDIPTTTKYLKFKGYYVRIDEIAGLTYDQNAPVMAVTPSENFVAGKVTAVATKTYTVANTGTGTLTVNIASDSEDFTVEPKQLVITDEAKEFTVTFNYTEGNYGEKSATITVTPTYDETAAVSFAATATAKNPNVWSEDFEEGKIPAYWTTTGWNVSQPSTNIGGNGTYMAGPSNNKTATLTTPRLQATKDQVLKFYTYAESETYFVKAEYSDDEQQTWNTIATYTDAGDREFTAPADGFYYIRFTGYYTYVDNFEGFKLALPDHIAAIKSATFPQTYTTLKEGVSFNAAVTVAESRGVAEELTAKYYMNGEVIGQATGTVEANSEVTLNIVCTPNTAAENAEMYIEVTYAGGILKSEVVTRTVTESIKLALNENSTDDIVAGTYDIVTLTRTFNAGWTTILLPFDVNVIGVFGVGAEAYQFNSYNDETKALAFSGVTTMTKGTPYLLYLPAAITEPINFGAKEIVSAGIENIYVKRDDVVLVGTFKPIVNLGSEGQRYGVTSDGKIMKAGQNSSIKGFRAYFEIDENKVKEFGDAESKGETVTGNVKYFAFDFTTGISEVEANEADKVMFNMAGQRIQKAQRGVNIINGRKVVVK